MWFSASLGEAEPTWTDVKPNPRPAGPSRPNLSFSSSDPVPEEFVFLKRLSTLSQHAHPSYVQKWVGSFFGSSFSARRVSQPISASQKGMTLGPPEWGCDKDQVECPALAFVPPI